MNILALESSAKAASCALWADGAPLASAWQCAGLTHSRTLLPMVEDMLRNCEHTMEDIDALAVAVGPGSFTGLRIGIATVKGLAWAADKPCIPVSTLEAMAWPLAHLEGVIVCAMDARRQQVYNAVFRAENGALTRLRDDRPIALADTAADLASFGGLFTIVGDGAELLYDCLTARDVPCRLAPPHLRRHSAVGVAMAAERAYPHAAVSSRELAPVYLRLSQAERERLERMRST